ncbi:hypothetical protein J6590_054766 [Homalodisca vitripennis]|nr:hypothetical protein J6590_054766 [Homalodisca vitripennis]
MEETCLPSLKKINLGLLEMHFDQLNVRSNEIPVRQYGTPRAERMSTAVGPALRLTCRVITFHIRSHKAAAQHSAVPPSHNQPCTLVRNFSGSAQPNTSYLAERPYV